ncbi:MAG: hypothetical protein ABR526_07575 [Chthoniobacterales bacterium]
MQRSLLLLLVGLSALAFSSTVARAEGLSASKSHFYYRNGSGTITGARIVRHYYGIPIVHALAQIDPSIDPRLRRAVSIAEERSSARTKARCWRYVKQALLDAGAVSSYPKTNYACQAGEELVRDFGFKKLPMRDPYAAPLGAVIVYGEGAGGAGHVELRTKDGFVSDYHSKNKCFYPVLAIYGKFTS